MVTVSVGHAISVKDKSEVKALNTKIVPLRSQRDGLQKSSAAIAEKAKAVAKLDSLNEESGDIDEMVALLKVASKAEALSTKLDALRDAENKRDKAFSKLSEQLEDETPESVRSQIKKLEDEDKKFIAKLSKFEDIDGDLDRLDEDYEDAKSHGVKFVSAREIASSGIQQVIDLVPAGAKVIVDLDCDALDPSIVPGVIGRSPGGLTYWNVVELLHGIAGKEKLSGFNLVEFMPDRDVDDIGALNNARIICNVLCELGIAI
jgi:chaperonin cofactor prefoldin